MLAKLRVRAPLLISVLAAGATVGAGCGGASKAAATGPSDPGADATATARGTTGLPGLDWGASADAVVAAFPRATPTDGGLRAVATADGHPSITKFTIGGDGLDQVDIEWTEDYRSMADVAHDWNQVRAKVDARLGPSKQDNLAAYWETPSASVTLACNPDDSGAAALSENFVPRQPE